MHLIYHITTGKEWKEALENGFYKSASLLTEGFIHCSTYQQVNGVRNRYFRNIENLVVLTIDASKLLHPLKYEWAASVNENFPHVYGVINLDAVIATSDPNHL